MDSAKSAVIYYSAAFVSGLALVSFLVHLFQWPVTASLVFGVSLFIQYMYLSRKVFVYLKIFRRKGYGIEAIYRNISGTAAMNHEVESEI